METIKDLLLLIYGTIILVCISYTVAALIPDKYDIFVHIFFGICWICHVFFYDVFSDPDEFSLKFAMILAFLGFLLFYFGVYYVMAYEVIIFVLYYTGVLNIIHGMLSCLYYPLLRTFTFLFYLPVTIKDYLISIYKYNKDK